MSRSHKENDFVLQGLSASIFTLHRQKMEAVQSSRIW